MKQNSRINYILPRIIIMFTVITTVVLGYFATTISLNPDINVLMPKVNKRIDTLKKNFDIHDAVTQYLFLSVESKKPYDLKTMQVFSDAINSISEIDDIEGVITPFNIITFDTEGKRIIPVRMSDSGAAPKDEKTLQRFVDRIRRNHLASNFVIADDGRILTAVFSTGTVTDPEGFMNKINNIINPLRSYCTIHITGDIPLAQRTGLYLAKDLRIFLSLSVLVMMFVFFLSFRTKRAVLLPMIVVITGTIWTVGFMALKGYSFTIVSIIIPPLLLTIGSSYTIHLLNEYYRNSKSNSADKYWITEAVRHITNTILLAGITTVIGFSSLLITSMPTLREFGLSFSFGVISTVALSLFFLPSIFYLLPDPAEKYRKAVKKGRFTKVTVQIGKFSVTHPYAVILGFIVIMILAVILFPSIREQSDYLSYFPSDDPVVEDTRFIIQHTGGAQALNITLSAPNSEKGYFLKPEILKKIDSVSSVLDSYPDVISTLSFPGILKEMNEALSGEFSVPENRGMILMLYRYFKMISKESFSLGSESSLISKDGSSVTIFLKVYDNETKRFLGVRGIKKLIDFTNRLLGRTLPPDVGYSLWGNTMLYVESNDFLDRDQIRTTLLSFFLVLIVSLIYFRSMVYAVVSVLPLAVSIAVYFISLAVFRIPLDMTTVLVTNVAIGVGLDDALHFLSRFKALRNSSEETVKRDLIVTMERTGRPIVLTTLSLAAGLMVLCFASFKPVVYFGLLIAGTLFTAMLSTVFLIPSLLLTARKFRVY